jgi:hypothetical protein
MSALGRGFWRLVCAVKRSLFGTIWITTARHQQPSHTQTGALTPTALAEEASMVAFLLPGHAWRSPCWSPARSAEHRSGVRRRAGPPRTDCGSMSTAPDIKVASFPRRPFPDDGLGPENRLPSRQLATAGLRAPAIGLEVTEESVKADRRFAVPRCWSGDSNCRSHPTRSLVSRRIGTDLLQRQTLSCEVRPAGGSQCLVG